MCVRVCVDNGGTVNGRWVWYGIFILILLCVGGCLLASGVCVLCIPKSWLRKSWNPRDYIKFEDLSNEEEDGRSASQRHREEMRQKYNLQQG